MDPSCFVSTGCYWWCNSGGNIFVMALISNGAQFKNATASMNITADHVHPIYGHISTLLPMSTSSWITGTKHPLHQDTSINMTVS